MTVRSRSFLLGCLAILLLLIAAGSLLYDPDYLKGLLLDQVERQVGRKIEVGEARLALFPRIRLDLIDVVIRDRDPSRIAFRAKHLVLILRSTPLMRLQVVVKRLAIDQPYIELRRSSTGSWSFLDTGEIEPGVGNPFGLLLMIQQATMTNGGVTIMDEFRPDGVRTVHLHTVDLSMVVSKKDRSADLHLSTTIPTTHGVSSLSFSGKLTHAQSPVRAITASPATAGPAVQFEGLAEALNVDIRQVVDFFGTRPVPERLHGAFNLRSRITIAPGVAGYDFVLSEMKSDVGRLSINGQASVSGLMTAQPTFALTFSSSPVDLDEVLSRFPIEQVDPQLHATLVEREIKGIVEVVAATVTGTTTPEPRISLTGEFHVLEGHMLVGQARTKAEHLAGTVVVEPDRVKLTEITGLYGPMRISNGKGTVAFSELGPWLELEVTGDMAASDLLPLLARALEPAPASNTLAELREVRGHSRVTFRLAGQLRAGDGVQFVEGEFQAQNVGFQSPLVHDPIGGLNGRVIFSPRAVEFDKLGGRLGQSFFEVDGVITLGSASAFKGFLVQTKLDAPQIWRFLRTEPHQSPAIQGTLDATLRLSGSTTAPVIKGQFDLKESGLQFPGSMQKPPGSPASVELEGRLARSMLSIDRVEVTLAPVHLSGKGKIRLGAKFAVDLALVSGPISIAKLPKGLSLGGIQSGTLEVSLNIKGKGATWRAWQIGGWVALTDGLIAAKGLDAPLSEVYLRLKLIQNGADLTRLAFKLKDSDLRLSGMIRDWNTTPTVTVNAESSQLDLDLLVPKGERSPIRDALEELAAGSRVDAKIAIDRGIYDPFMFRNLSGRISIKNGALDIDLKSGQANDGQIAGRLLVHLPKSKPADMAGSFQVTDIPFEKVFRLAGDQQRLITGSLTAAGTVQGNGHDPEGPLHSLNGKIEGSVKQGRIQRGTVLPKILKILNLPALLQGKVDLSREGMPFDKQSATFGIKDGIVTSENILVDSPVLKMSAAGSYDLPNDRLNFVVAVSPLGSYSELIDRIPLFGKLLAGERKGIATALFEVKGPLKEPRVRYMPLQSLATGVTGLAHLAFDVLKNAVTLPKELIKPGKDQSPAGESERAPEQSAPAVP